MTHEETVETVKGRIKKVFDPYIDMPATSRMMRELEANFLGALQDMVEEGLIAPDIYGVKAQPDPKDPSKVMLTFTCPSDEIVITMKE